MAADSTHHPASSLGIPTNQLTGGLLPIPAEVTEHALAFCHPNDVFAFALTSKAAHALVFNTRDTFLWRALFLAYPFDDPRRTPRRLRDGFCPDGDSGRCAYDWQRGLQSRVLAERRILTDDVSVDEVTLNTLVTVLDEVRLVPKAEPSHNIVWATKLLEGHGDRIKASAALIRVLASDSKRNQVQQLCSRIRAYLSLSLDGLGPWLERPRDDIPENYCTAIESTRRQSRARVYTLQHYNEQNMWGPFMSYKSTTQEYAVNWRQVEAIVNVLALNIKDVNDELMEIDGNENHSDNNSFCMRPPMGLSAIRPGSAPTSAKAVPGDWAGVEGRWRRFVCFMDYRDLFAFNYTTLGDGPRNPTFFDQVSFREATRLIAMDLHVTRIGDVDIEDNHAPRNQSPPIYPRTPQPVGPSGKLAEAYPTIYFTGTSSSSNGHSASLSGTVRMANDGTVRWSWLYKISEHEAHVAWSSEGVQLGHERSAAGIVGIWTGATHDDDDPAGPFWMWKVPDNSPARWYDYT